MTKDLALLVGDRAEVAVDHRLPRQGRPEPQGGDGEGRLTRPARAARSAQSSVDSAGVSCRQTPTRDVEALLALHAHRLQRDRVASSRRAARWRRRRDRPSLPPRRRRSCRRARRTGRRPRAPARSTRSRELPVKPRSRPNLSIDAVVALLAAADALEHAVEILGRAEDEADAAGDLAGQTPTSTLAARAGARGSAERRRPSRRRAVRRRAEIERRIGRIVVISL